MFILKGVAELYVRTLILGVRQRWPDVRHDQSRTPKLPVHSPKLVAKPFCLPPLSPSGLILVLVG